MILALRLAWRDLRGGFGRFAIFIACLALGIAAMAAVDTVSHGIRSALSDDGRTILGGDFSVRSLYLPATPEQRQFLAGSGTVSESGGMRAMARAGDQSTLVELKAVDHAYPLYGAMDLAPRQDLAAALANNGAVVDQDVLDRLNLKVGGSLTLGSAQFHIAAIIEREPDRAGAPGLVLGPRVMIARKALDATALVQPGSLIYWNYAIRLAPGQNAASIRKSLDETGGPLAWQVRSFDEAAPSLKRLVDRLTQFLTLISVSALAVGGIGIANASKAAVETRLASIAVMKCLGAPKRLVFLVFLIEMMAMASVGIALGLIMGIGVPVLAGPALARALPIVPHFTAGIGTVTLMATYGFLITLICSLPVLLQAGVVSPVILFRSRIATLPFHLRGRHMIVLAALCIVFLALLLWRSTDRHLSIIFLVGLWIMLQTFSSAGDWFVSLARRISPHLNSGPVTRLALGNLHRPGNRTRDIALSLGMGLSVLIAVGLVESNFRHDLGAQAGVSAPTFFFLDIQKAEFEEFKAAILAVPGTSDFQATPMLRGRISAVNGVPAESAITNRSYAWVLGSDRGITYGADLPDGSKLVEGQWWSGAAGTEPLVSITTEIARAFGVHPGDHVTVTIAGRDITGRIANIREVRWGTLNINFTLLFAPGALDAAPQTWLATVRANGPARVIIARDIAQRFTGISIVDVRQALSTIAGIMDKIASAIRLAASVILITGILVLIGAVSAGFERRLNDAVVMKVLGGTRARLFAVFLLEYGATGLVSVTIAMVLGAAASWWIVTRVFGFEWVFYPGPAALATLLSLGVTLGTGFFTTLVVLGRKASTYLRNE